MQHLSTGSMDIIYKRVFSIIQQQIIIQLQTSNKNKQTPIDNRHLSTQLHKKSNSKARRRNKHTNDTAMEF